MPWEPKHLHGFHGNESIFMAAMVTRPTKVFVQNLIPFPECFGKTLTQDQMKFHTESILSIIVWIICRCFSPLISLDELEI